MTYLRHVDCVDIIQNKNSIFVIVVMIDQILRHKTNIFDKKTFLIKIIFLIKIGLIGGIKFMFVVVLYI